jgi:MFS family permease
MKSNDPFTPLLLTPAHSFVGWHVLLVNSMANWTLAFMTTSINVALPVIQGELQLGAVALGWLPLAYLLASAIFLLPLGRLADGWGRRRMFILGMIIFTVCSLALVFSGSYIPLVALRGGQGLGASMVFAGSAAMVTLAYPRERRGFVMGVSAAAAYLGQTTGPPIGGVLVHNFGWRSLFIVSAAFGALLLVLDAVLLRNAEWKETGAKGFDYVGPLVYAPALFAFLLGMSWIPQLKGVALVAAGVLGMVLFVWWEGRARSPVIEVGLFRHNRVFAMSNLSQVISYAAVWALTFLMSLYLQFIRGLNPETAGFVLMAGVAVQAACTPFAGRLSDHFQPRWLASGGMGICAVGMLFLAFLRVATPYWYIIAILCLLGIGYALFAPANMSSIMGSVERRNLGVASASVGTMRVVGQAVSIGVATMVMAVIVGRHNIMPADYPNLLTAVRVTFGILAVFCVIGIAASMARGDMPARRSQQVTETP